MGALSPRVAAYTDADIDAIVDDLNATATDAERVHAWAARSGVPITRAVAIPDLTYVRLAGKDESGGYIVLMLLDGTWERAI